MKTIYKILVLTISVLLFSCKDSPKHQEEDHEKHEKHEEHDQHEEHDEQDEHDEHEAESAHNHEEESHNEFSLTQQQYEALQMQVGKVVKKNMGAYIQVNGQLKVPPKNEASITSFIGANVVAIKVIEGEKIAKGQVVAYLSHPDIITEQTSYLTAINKVNLLQKSFERQKKLYDAGVASGSSFQKVEAEYQQAKSLVQGLKAQLKMLHINADEVANGKMFNQIPLVSPIKGYVQKVSIKTGQYVTPQTELFEVVNTDRVHADLMVYEKDIPNVKKGQKVRFSVQTRPNEALYATIFSVGKVFEENPKAVHIHATIHDKKENLIPGMYIQGKIEVASEMVNALPEAALINEGDNQYIFSVEKEEDTWHFKKIEVIKGNTDANWSAVRFLEEVGENTQFALNNAYYLIAELKKGELEHAH